MDKEKVRELAGNVRQLLDLHKQKHETVKKLLTICVKHLKDRRRLIPDETWQERLQLIQALEIVINEE